MAEEIAEVETGTRRERVTELAKDKDDGPSGLAGMAIKEFVAALVRLAWACLPKRNGIGERLTTLMEHMIYPQLARALDESDLRLHTVVRKPCFEWPASALWDSVCMRARVLSLLWSTDWDGR